VRQKAQSSGETRRRSIGSAENYFDALDPYSKWRSPSPMRPAPKNSESQSDRQPVFFNTWHNTRSVQRTTISPCAINRIIPKRTILRTNSKNSPRAEQEPTKPRIRAPRQAEMISFPRHSNLR
jgi:hypothetical protein